MLDVRRLRVLREVAARGSLSAAAEAMSFSQPAISNQIAKLELEAGTALVERVPRGVRLTEAGELLVRHADVVLRRLELAETELGELLAVRRGHLRLGTFPSSFVDLVSRSVARFCERHPAVEISLREVALEEAKLQLATGELDLAVSFEYGLAPSPTAAGVGLQQLLEDRMYLALARDHPLAARPRLRLEHLAGEKWIQYTTGPASKVLYRAFLRAGYEPDIVLETDDLLAIQGLVAAGFAVTMVPGMALPTLRPELMARSLGRDLPTRRVNALWPEDHRSPAASAMLEILLEEAPGLSARLAALCEADSGRSPGRNRAAGRIRRD
jgi:DNA-binding transcriptional LysR family regulator